MFRAIGLVLIIWYLSTLFSQSFNSADSAISESFKALEAAAVMSQKELTQ